MKDVIAFVFSGMYYLSAVITLFGYLKEENVKNKSIAIILTIIAFCVVFIFAWGTANTGTAARHRDKIVTLIALILANCLSTKEENNKPVSCIYLKGMDI